MSKFVSGEFRPKNPEKYIGKGRIHGRSSWEFVVFNFFDQHPNVEKWASESISIPYKNPLTGKAAMYFPDLFVIYVDKDGNKHAELIEIKPIKEASLKEAKSGKDRALVAKNNAKWAAAAAWCEKNSITFRVITEFDIFRMAGSK